MAPHPRFSCLNLKRVEPTHTVSAGLALTCGLCWIMSPRLTMSCHANSSTGHGAVIWLLKPKASYRRAFNIACQAFNHRVNQKAPRITLSEWFLSGSCLWVCLDNTRTSQPSVAQNFAKKIWVGLDGYLPKAEKPLRRRNDVQYTKCYSNS